MELVDSVGDDWYAIGLGYSSPTHSEAMDKQNKIREMITDALDHTS